jgi:hypothetical protein
VLSLSSNLFSVRTDSFLDEVTKLRNQTVLDLFTTNISGVIPARISNLVNLVDLDLGNNYLTDERSPGSPSFNSSTYTEIPSMATSLLGPTTSRSCSTLTSPRTT